MIKKVFTWIWILLNIFVAAFIAYKVISINNDKIIIAALYGHPLFILINVIIGKFVKKGRLFFWVAAFHFFALLALIYVDSTYTW